MDKLPMHVVVPSQLIGGRVSTVQAIANTFKKAFADRYDIVFTPKGVEIKADDVMVVTFSNEANVEKILEAIDKYAEQRLKKN